MTDIAWFNPTRWLLGLCLLLALWLGYQAWAAHQQGIGYQRATAEYARQAATVDAARAAIAKPIEAAHKKAVTKIVTITETIIKEVPTYVQADNNCALPGGWRLLHDAAADGQLPDPARIADAVPISAQDAAATVVTNYGACHETAQRLMDLQSWVRAQQSLKP